MLHGYSTGKPQLVGPLLHKSSFVRARNGSHSRLPRLRRVGGRTVDTRDLAAHGAQIGAELTAVVDGVLDG